MLGFNVFAAETDAEAKLFVTSVQQAVVNLRTGRPTWLPPPRQGHSERLGPHERVILSDILSCSAIGAPETVARELSAFVAHTGADELMITSQIYDHAAKVWAYQIVADVWNISAVPSR